MFLCIAVFICMFAFVFGIALLLLMPSSMGVIVWDTIPLPMLIMVAGFLGSLISLWWVHSLGDYFSDTDENTKMSTFRRCAWIGFFSAIAMSVIQLYLRLEYGEYGFFANGGNIRDALEGVGLESRDGQLLFAAVLLAFFLGLPWFILSYFGCDFSRYITVTQTFLSDGSSYESARSESYVSVGQFILMGFVLTVPFVALSTSVVTYFFAGAFGVFLFAKSKRSLIVSSVVFGILAVALTVLSLVH